MRSEKFDAHRLARTILYLLCLCAASTIVGIYGYFLPYLSLNGTHVASWKKAIEGISGAAVLYSLINAILTCCLSHRPFLAVISIILDICFAAGFAAISVLTRQSASSCSGYLHTPLGSGVSYSTPLNSGARDGRVPYLWFVCSLNKAVFAVSIVAMFILASTAVIQLLSLRRLNWQRSSGHTAQGFTRA
jgi:lysylphosphatidylglycerol synthetase-like protein (DUF2156 family)